MKVYDTDEAAVARGTRQRMLARLIQLVLVLAFSALGIWVFYSLFLTPDKKEASRLPTTTVGRLSSPSTEPLIRWSVTGRHEAYGESRLSDYAFNVSRIPSQPWEKPNEWVG
jgi:hypothetical protein